MVSNSLKNWFLFGGMEKEMVDNHLRNRGKRSLCSCPILYCISEKMRGEMISWSWERNDLLNFLFCLLHTHTQILEKWLIGLQSEVSLFVLYFYIITQYLVWGALQSFLLTLQSALEAVRVPQAGLENALMGTFFTLASGYCPWVSYLVIDMSLQFLEKDVHIYNCELGAWGHTTGLVSFTLLNLGRFLLEYRGKNTYIKKKIRMQMHKYWNYFCLCICKLSHVLYGFNCRYCIRERCPKSGRKGWNPPLNALMSIDVR